MPPLAARGGATTLLWSRSAPPKIRPTRRAAEIWLCLARCIGTGAQHGAALMLGQQRTQYDTERPRLVSGGTLAARQSERARLLSLNSVFLGAAVPAMAARSIIMVPIDVAIGNPAPPPERRVSTHCWCHCSAPPSISLSSFRWSRPLRRLTSQSPG